MVGLGTSRSRLYPRSRSQNQDLSHLVLRPRSRPQPPGLETKIKTLVTRSWDRDQDLSLQVSSELEFETLGLKITSLILGNLPHDHILLQLMVPLRLTLKPIWSLELLHRSSPLHRSAHPCLSNPKSWIRITTEMTIGLVLFNLSATQTHEC